jgi:hypothetical protein
MEVLSGQCAICKKSDTNDTLIVLSRKGAEGINNASKLRKDVIIVADGFKVHSTCRKRYTDKKDISIHQKQINDSPVKKRSIRSTDASFRSNLDCILCGTFVHFNDKYGRSGEGIRVQTDTFAHSIMACCKQRQDEWSHIVRGRLEYLGLDLQAANCVYHNSCSVNFRTGNLIPKLYACNENPSVKKRRSGRPENELQKDAFRKICAHLDAHNDEQVTVGDLMSLMEGFLQGTELSAYDRRYMKRQLLEHYGDNIVISGQNGKVDVITLRETAHQILRSYYAMPKESEDAEKMWIIDTAARLIKSDIKSNLSGANDTYPSCEELELQRALQYLPLSLRMLLTKLFSGKDTENRVASIGQCVMQAVRPRALLPPLQIGLAIQMHYHFRSKHLVETLHNLGFCSSYSEVKKFERNAATVASENLMEADKGGVLLLAADNVDHNAVTLNGENTFHGMGMLGAITPGTRNKRMIPRQTVTDADVRKLAVVPLYNYREAKAVLNPIKFTKFTMPTSEESSLDILWKLSWYFREPTANWSGMMQGIYNNQTLQYPGQSTVLCLPIIDLQPSNMDCILSTLTFLSNLARKNNMTPTITFDQPLFWKASQILNNKTHAESFSDVVLLLGSFHTLMNLLGAIGTLMGGSGLQEILQEVYGENAVIHILSGKSVSRAFRAHMIVDLALSSILINDVFPKSSADSDKHHPVISEAEILYEQVKSNSIPISEVESSPTLQKVRRKLESRKIELATNSSTSKLWINYQQMVNTARRLVASDRTGSWSNHLSALEESLPIFAAAGHFNYLKSVSLYLQTMKSLPITNPILYAGFEEGLHVIRRSDRFWAGLGSDLVIEQVMMRALKSTGGLTRGTGFSDVQRAIWVLAMPACCEYNLGMQKIAKTLYETSEQHKEEGKTRLVRDTKDTEKVIKRLQEVSPFTTDSSLRNVVTGVTADSTVNVHNLYSIGSEIVTKLDGKDVFAFKWKRSDRVKTLASTSSIKVDDNSSIDPALLFQRMLVVSKTGNMSLEEVLKYELCSYPPSLFDSRTMLRKADKPPLAHAILKHLNINDSNHPKSTEEPHKFILDGGSLLHRLTWTRGSTYDDIASSYAKFTTEKYGSATIVFDSYVNAPSIKDVTHRRRCRDRISTNVNFTPQTVFSGNKENFLSNSTNKQRIINLIGIHLTLSNCTVIHASGDADVDIVKEAVSSSENMNTTVIGEDTDLLLLLLHHSRDSRFSLVFRSDVNRKAKSFNSYNINLIRQGLGPETCEHLLFLHAFTGCDSTSRIHSVGKTSAFRKLLNDKDLREMASVFCATDQHQHKIAEAGQRAMLILCGGKPDEELVNLRHRMLCDKVFVSKGFITPERLPPTKSATKYHSLRVYYQVQVWKSDSDIGNPQDWGWLEKNNEFYPLMCDLPPAPASLLSKVRCNCASGCVTTRCSCRKNGLPCTTACGHCQQAGCENEMDIEKGEDVDNNSDLE